MISIGVGRNWNTWRSRGRQKSWEASLFKAAIWNITWWDHKFPPRAHSFCFWVDSGVVTAWVCGARGRADKIYLEIWSYRVVVYPVMVFNVNQCPKALPLNCVTHPLASPQTRLVDRYIRNKAKPIPKTGANASSCISISSQTYRNHIKHWVCLSVYN